MWIYTQDKGGLYWDRKDPNARVAIGYSGREAGINDPDMQNVQDYGPIPVGFYAVGSPIDTSSHGPFVLPLDPSSGNEMFGRSAFLIHGDSISQAGLRLASHGCIILPRSVRELIWNSGDHILQVIRTHNA